MERLKKSISDHERLFSQIPISPEDIDYEKANAYLPFFRLLDSSQTSLLVSFDFYKRDYFYFSESFNEVFGFYKHKLPQINHKFIRSRFHPDDFIINTGSMKALQYLYQQPIEKRKDYRIIHEFRIRNDDDKWTRLIVQNDILELDEKGNPWLDLKLWDFSPIQDIDAPGRFVFRNKFTGEVIYALEGQKTENSGISVREREVLSLIADGMKSKQIAEKLFISANTVNNHRRNLIEKLDVSNTTEAVKMALKLGII
jgi:DNA-binding CsgD family transcriptional regulator